MNKHIQGVSLIELVISILIILGIGVTVAPLMKDVSDALVHQYSAGGTQDQVLIALERIGRELRETRSTSDFTLNASSITFTINDGTSISYSLSGTNLLRGGNTIADNITGFTLAYYDDNGATTATAGNVRYIKVTVTATNVSNSQTFYSTVFPRSFA